MTMRIFWNDTAGVLQEIEFDASIEENHESTAEATKHPIEGGSSVTDGVNDTGDHITLQARISNTPIRVPRTQMEGITGSLGTVDLGSFVDRRLRKGATANENAQYDTVTTRENATVLTFSNAFDRVKEVHRVLVAVKRAKQVVSLDTSLAQYDNCIITKIGAPRKAEEGNAITFALELEPIRFADSQLVDTPAPSQARGHGRSNRGASATTDETEGGHSESLAHQAIQGLRNVFGGG